MPGELESLRQENERLREEIGRYKSASEALGGPVSRSAAAHFQTLAGELSGRFVSVSTKDLDRAINWAIRKVGVHVQGNAVHLVRFSSDGQFYGMSHLWQDGTMRLSMREVQSISTAATPFWSGQLLAQSEVSFTSVQELSALARDEAELLKAQGVESRMSVPLVSDGEVLGALTCDSARPGHAFSRQDVSLLRFAAEIFASALVRRRTEAALRSSEEQLLQAQRMEAIGRLAGGVAHDFNNLLTGILGYADEALLRLGPDDPSREEMEEIAHAAERAADLTRQLLAFSRKQIGQPRVVSAGDEIGQAEKLLARVIGEDIEVTFTRSEAPWQIAIDPGQLNQILMNLATNARDAMLGGGFLQVTTTQFVSDAQHFEESGTLPPGEYVVLIVSDNGKGIPAELRSQIFEPFFTTKGAGKGTGLGLSTVYGLVKQNGGYVEVNSEVGVGTTFTIYFPRALSGHEVIPAEPQMATSPRGQESILLVEDDALVRGLAMRVLTRQGYRVQEAPSGDAALRLVKAGALNFDMLLSDVVMPGMTGPELLEQLKPILPELKCLFMSGYAEDVIVHHGVTDADKSLLPKPFSAEKLAMAVREILDGHAFKDSSIPQQRVRGRAQ